jgi:pyruvate formate lyase activating enzyme
MKEAMFYRPDSGGEVTCQLCAHGCRVREGKTGLCGVRVNRGGKLYSMVYGMAIAGSADPIEKKPLFHFQPGSRSFSIATVGCNFRCRHCQNAEISQMPVDQGRIGGRWMGPEEVVRLAVAEGCRSISYTYTEPTVYYEYAFDTAKLSVGAGLMNVFVTNGFIEAEPLKSIQPWLHAANVDLKSFRDRFYREVCKARLAPVLDTLKLVKQLGIWLEVTTLLIPGWNDDDRELRDLAGFLRDLDPEIPWHVSAFHPSYQMTDRNRTPWKALRKAREIGLEQGLHFVYTGNAPGDEGENTLCPGCGACVIRRHGFRVVSTYLNNEKCGGCGRAIPLRMEGERSGRPRGCGGSES